MSKAHTPPDKKSAASPFNKAIKQGDSNAAINIMLDKLDESNELSKSLLDHIAKQDHIIMQYRGLTALAKGMGHI